MQTKSGFNVIKLVEIPESFLRKEVLKELEGRGLYIDLEDDINEEVYSGDIFEVIASEQAELPKHSPFKLSDEDLKQVDTLAEELGEYELVRINKV